MTRMCFPIFCSLFVNVTDNRSPRFACFWVNLPKIVRSVEQIKVSFLVYLKWALMEAAMHVVGCVTSHNLIKYA